MACLDLEKLNQTKPERSPFEFIIVPGFVKAKRLKEINQDFPAIEKAGNFPIEDLTYGTAFKTFLDEIKSPKFQDIVEKKFNMSLQGTQHLVTVRGFSEKSDGNIHTDSPSKVVTALIYLNENWDSDGGRLRLLRNSHDIDDYVAEVPPVSGTLLVFKRSENSWHGHKRFAGPRRTIQLNWVSNAIADNTTYRKGQVKRRVMRWLGLHA
jgi:hypothetical protein